jgi:hypothetical protein
MQELNWSKNREDFRAIFIAGNEPFDQGPRVWNQAIDLAVKADTLVNTIYCGSAESQERQLWASGASLAKGSHFNISQDRKIAVIESPYDSEISTWNTKLNQTYIPYGREGTSGQQRQFAEDRNSGMNLVSRSSSKASEYYDNASWDLLDALENGRVTLEAILDNDLPAIMRGMTLTEKRAYVAAKKTERQAIQRKIRELSQKRNEYINRQRKANTEKGENTVDRVIIQSLTQQLAAKGFKLN